MEDELTIFEVLTEYKTDRNRTETIAAPNETEMWKIYDRRHRRSKDKISGSMIVDAWCA